jgi:hypothetical protein
MLKLECVRPLTSLFHELGEVRLTHDENLAQKSRGPKTCQFRENIAWHSDVRCSELNCVHTEEACHK